MLRTTSIKAKNFSTSHTHLLSAALIFLFSLIYFSPYLGFNKTIVPYDLLSKIQPWASQSDIDYQNIMMGDVLLQVVPWHILYRNAIRSGEIPFWNPYSAGGSPFMANHMSGVFYPFNLIFLALPLDAGFTVFGIVHKFIAGLGMYFLIRRLGLRPLSGLVGALTWMYSGYLTVWLPWLAIAATLTWLPWAILLVEMIIAEGRWQHVGWLAIVCALIFLGGHIQFTYYSYILIAGFTAWWIFTSKSSARMKITRFAKIALGVSLGLAAVSVQLVPTLELSGNIVRGVISIQTLMKSSVPVNYLPTLLIPEFLGNVNQYRGTGNFVEFTGYIGIFGWTLIGAAVFFPQWRKRKELWIFAILALISLHLVFGGRLNLLLQYLPGYTFFRTLVRIYAVWTFAASILVAIGIEALIFAQGWRYKILLVYGAILAVMGCLFNLNAWFMMIGIVKAFDIPLGTHMNTLHLAFWLLFFSGLILLGVLAAFRLDSWPKAFLLSLTLLIISLDLLHFSRDYLPVVDIPTSFPTAPSISYLETHRDAGRIARYRGGYLGSPLSPNLGIIFGLEDIDAYDSFSIQRYGQLVGAIEADRYTNLFNYNTMNGFTEPSSFGSQILQILRVAFVLSEKPIPELAPSAGSPPQPRWLQVYSEPDLTIYQNQHVLPLVGIYGHYRVESDLAGRLDILSSSNFDPLEEILLDDAAQGDIDSRANGNVQILEQTYNRLDFQVDIDTQAGKSAIVMIAQNNYPGWQAQIDGQQGEIFTADEIWQAIVVPAGEHSIHFTFLPSHFSTCILVTLLSLSMILFLVIFGEDKTVWMTNILRGRVT